MSGRMSLECCPDLDGANGLSPPAHKDKFQVSNFTPSSGLNTNEKVHQNTNTQIIKPEFESMEKDGGHQRTYEAFKLDRLPFQNEVTCGVYSPRALADRTNN